MYKLVLLRHGESLWNQENRFTGWTDVALSSKGIEEAQNAARLLVQKGFSFDVAYTSFLKRAVKTLWLVLEEMDLMWLPVYKTWSLNERHYGGLQGLNKKETEQKYGKSKVLLWRRSFDTLPPTQLGNDLPSSFPTKDHPKDHRYKDLRSQKIPTGESLKNTMERVLPYWEREIVPKIQEGKRILLVAHGNSIRSLVKALDSLSNEEILKVNIPTGSPLMYTLDQDLKPISRSYLD